MNLAAKLAQRAASPVRVGLIGAGKFAAMFLAQARRTPGLHVAAIADLSPARARANAAATGWPDGALDARDIAEAIRTGATWLVEDGQAVATASGIEVVIEATGDPTAGVRHAMAAIAAKKHLVMVNVETDVLVGPLLARRAAEAGVVYSLAYGDQPALICEQVDWARAAGFAVVAAGKGTKHRPEFHASTPDTVWGFYGLTPDHAAESGMNPKMFNSFLDGTKSGIEMAAVANATGLVPAPGGLSFPPCAVYALAERLKPKAEGGLLAHKGQVEVVSSHDATGEVANNLRWGTYVVFEAADDYVRRCFADYGLKTDSSGRYAALWRPYHLIGLELGISVASVALRGEPTGAPTGFRADVVCVAKRRLEAGEVLDGEGGYRVWGRLMPAADSLAMGALPIGLAHGRLARAVEAGQVVHRADVALDETVEAVRLRAEMERLFAPGAARAAE